MDKAEKWKVHSISTLEVDGQGGERGGAREMASGSGARASCGACVVRCVRRAVVGRRPLAAE